MYDTNERESSLLFAPPFENTFIKHFTKYLRVIQKELEDFRLFHTTLPEVS